MPLTGQAKTDYQREYMRRRRSNKKAVRPTALDPKYVRPNEDTLDAIEELESGCGIGCDELFEEPQGITVIDELPDVIPNKVIKRCAARIEPQSYNPMMVGYVPPTE
jgi:hypothetical protein